MIPKFRVWIPDPDVERMLRVKGLVFESDKTRCICGYTYDFYLEDEDASIMQSTGLFDKNGKEIFEGDILKFNDEWPDYCYEGYVDGSIEGINYVEIKREKTYFAFGKTKIPESSLIDLVEEEHYPFEELLAEASYEFEIIGNIYENTELLGGEG